MHLRGVFIWLNYGIEFAVILDNIISIFDLFYIKFEGYFILSGRFHFNASGFN